MPSYHTVGSSVDVPLLDSLLLRLTAFLRFRRWSRFTRSAASYCTRVGGHSKEDAQSRAGVSEDERLLLQDAVGAAASCRRRRKRLHHVIDPTALHGTALKHSEGPFVAGRLVLLPVTSIFRYQSIGGGSRCGRRCSPDGLPTPSWAMVLQLG